MTSTSIAHAFDPGSIFWPYYVLSALGIALAWLSYARGLKLVDGIRLIFSRDTWLDRSTLTDLALCAFYLLVLRTAIKSVENTAFLASLRWTRGTLSAPEAWTFALPPLLEGALATLVTMVSIDLASYAVHRLMHRSPLLWRVHRFHHSARRLTPLTTYRQHPLEPILLYGARGLASGIGLALLYSVLPQRTPVITVFGLGAGFFVYMFTVNLHHAPVPVRYPAWLCAVLISPHIHHLHHSVEPRHHDRNFGVVFSIWDKLFGTYVDENVEPGTLRFGLKG